MLTELRVQNFALIDDVTVEFHEGLNILSGETGAGKSIIMGSVNMALGSKASKDSIRRGCNSAYVELTFHLSESQKERIAALDLDTDEDDNLVISRKITDTKSLSRINGETVNLSVVREAASILIDLHGQTDNQTITRHDKQLELLDAFASAENGAFEDFLSEYRTALASYREVTKKLDSFDMDEAKRLREISFLEYVIDEIEQAELSEEEEEELAEQLKKLSNQQSIAEGMGHVRSLLFESSGSSCASDQVSEAVQTLQKLVVYDRDLEQTVSSLTDVEALLSDLAKEVDTYCDLSCETDPAELDRITRRVDQIHDLKNKYGRTIAEVLEYQAKQSELLKELKDYQIHKEENEQQQKALRERLLMLGEKLHKARKKAAGPLADRISTALADLNFLNAEFEIRVERQEESFLSEGQDQVSFYISPNPGEVLKPISEIASGGELSRIMLALKTVLADEDEIESFVFDEIDAGISGRTAQKVAEKLITLSGSHQVICISHLSQIVSMADYHYLIEKKVEGGTTRTEIRQLDYEDSVTEIARLLSGTEVTQSVLDTAWEMKDLAQKAKYH